VANNAPRADYLDVSYSEQRKPVTGYPLQLARMVAERYLGATKGLLLDIGCGRGDQIRGLAAVGFTVAGADLSPRSPELARGEYPVAVFNFETDAFPWPDGHADFVFCKSIIEHMREPDHLVSECLRVLKPGGRAIFITPNWDRMYREFYTEYTHRTPFTRKSLGDCLLINGFVNVTVDDLIQLPIVWRVPALRPFTRVLALAPNALRRYKAVRWSKDVMLLGVGRKPAHAAAAKR
jgi:SAM-dependent methyltransferase